jgi:excisionase family DNA binding protein
VPLNLPTDESFLTTEEVLAYLNVNLRTVYRLIKAGSIPAVRVGRQWRFRKRDLDSWLESQRPAEQKPNAIVKSRSRILLVSIRRLLSRMLESAYDVEVAADGESALRLMREPDAHYDLLISDLNMPGMDGLALIREARRIDATLPAIVITGFSSESIAIEALNLGVAGYLTKPFGTTQVLAAAAKALGVRSA